MPENAIGASAGGGEDVVGALNGEVEVIGSAPGIAEGRERGVLAFAFSAEGIEIAKIVACAGVVGRGNFGEALFFQSVKGAREAESGEIVAGVGRFVRAIAEEFEDFVGLLIVAVNAIETAPRIEQRSGIEGVLLEELMEGSLVGGIVSG